MYKAKMSAVSTSSDLQKLLEKWRRKVDMLYDEVCYAHSNVLNDPTFDKELKQEWHDRTKELEEAEAKLAKLEVEIAFEKAKADFENAKAKLEKAKANLSKLVDEETEEESDEE